MKIFSDTCINCGKKENVSKHRDIYIDGLTSLLEVPLCLNCYQKYFSGKLRFYGKVKDIKGIKDIDIKGREVA